MQSLTEVAYITRKTIKYFTVFLIAITVTRLSYKAFVDYWRKLHPPPPPPPDVSFGQLPPVRFGDEILDKKPRKFRLETIDGELPQMPDRAKVYFVYSTQSKILAFEKMKRLANSLGFTQEPKKIREDVYSFHNPVTNQTLTINALTQTFKLSYPYLEDQTLTTFFNFSSEQEAIEAARAFLDRVGKNYPDLQGNERATLLKLTPTKLVKATAISEANIIQVDFFRTDLEETYPVYPGRLDKANVYFLVSSAPTTNKRIIEANFLYFPIDKEKFATYPLKSIQTAWQELEEGKYHLAQIDKEWIKKTIPIRKIYLAYFDPHYPTNFLQPIFVFQGDGNFFGFVPAVSPEWIKE